MRVPGAGERSVTRRVTSVQKTGVLPVTSAYVAAILILQPMFT